MWFEPKGVQMCMPPTLTAKSLYISHELLNMVFIPTVSIPSPTVEFNTKLLLDTLDWLNKNVEQIRHTHAILRIS